MKTKTIQDFPSYVIHSDGRVVNTVTGKEKSAVPSKNGYKTVDLYNKGFHKPLYIHRLVALAFLPNPDDKRTVNHIDGIKTNNNVSNLEWATDSENIQHAYDTGLHKVSSKVTEDHLVAIYTRFFNGENLTEISEDLPYNNVTVSNHFTKYINTLGEEQKRKDQEKLNVLTRMKKAGVDKRKSKNIKMISMETYEVVKVFGNIAEAQEYSKKDTSGPISNALSGRSLSGYGFYWIEDNSAKSNYSDEAATRWAPKPKNGKKYRGIYLRKDTGKYKAIYLDKTLGNCNTEEEAIICRNNYMLEQGILHEVQEFN
jgi:hypothetical protein